MGQLLCSAQKGLDKSEDNFERNTIDPFSALFEMAILGYSKNDWLNAEKSRQAQKSLSNAIGAFHQQVLSCVHGWQDLKTSNQIDLVNHDRKMIAEVKNKHNTMKASNLSVLYRQLSELISKKHSMFNGYTAYYVEIIPKNTKPYNRPFTPSDNSEGRKCATDENIRQIDGRSFYALVTGESDAIEQLFSALPTAIADCSGSFLKPVDINFVKGFFEQAFMNACDQQA